MKISKTELGRFAYDHLTPVAAFALLLCIILIAIMGLIGLAMRESENPCVRWEWRVVYMYDAAVGARPQPVQVCAERTSE